MTTQVQLIRSLKRIRQKLCAYTGQSCDCKFMNDSDDFICMGSENGSGCPELFVVFKLIEAMTPAEFVRISKRAGVSRHFDDVETRLSEAKPKPKKRKPKANKSPPLLDKQTVDEMFEKFKKVFVMHEK